MTSFERRIKEAFKTALAMILAYGIALSWDWMNPYWAGVSVAVISLPTAGQSIEKGAMRLLGTLLASVAALALLSVFPQDRWLFMTLVSAYVGACTYLMIGSRNQYFWLVSGFVALIICVDAGPNPEDAFNTAVFRSLETALGIIVYTLVSVFLWPQSSAAQLEETARHLLGSQRKLFEAYRSLSVHKDRQSQTAPNPAEVAQLLARLAQQLNAAASENYNVRERRNDWLALHRETSALTKALESWRTSFPEIQHLEMEKLIPNLGTVYTEIDKIFEEIELAWAGKRSDDGALETQLYIDQSAARELSHLDRAAVFLMKANLDRVVKRCHEICESVRALKGLSKSVRKSSPQDLPASLSLVDPDRINGVLKVTATLWLGYLIWIYVDPPGHASFVQISGTFALLLVSMPQARASMLFLPFALGSGFAGIIYLLVMPRLSGFSELAAVLFAAVFIINLVYYQPRQGLSRLVGMITLLVITSVQNQQVYSFQQFIITATMMLLAVLFVSALSYLPFSPRPEKVFLRLLSRYVNCGTRILNRLGGDTPGGGWGAERWTADYCRYSLRNLPERLAQLSHGISVTPNCQEKTKKLLSSIQVLNHRIFAVEEAHRLGRPELVPGKFSDELSAWRSSLLRLFRDWGQSSPRKSHDETAMGLQQRLKSIEELLEDGIGSMQGQRVSDEFYSKIYGLLGSYRGLSEAVVDFTKASDGVDWPQWREARF